jgi:hypothetical protein
MATPNAALADDIPVADYLLDSKSCPGSDALVAVLIGPAI